MTVKYEDFNGKMNYFIGGVESILIRPCKLPVPNPGESQLAAAVVNCKSDSCHLVSIDFRDSNYILYNFDQYVINIDLDKTETIVLPGRWIPD